MNPSALSTGLKWGLIYGLVSVIFGLLLYVLNQSTNMALASIGILIFITFIIMAMRSHYKLSNSMTYGQGILIGLLIGLIGGVFGAVYYYAMYSLDPQLVEATQRKSMEFSENLMQMMGASQDQIDDALDQAEENGQFDITPLRQAISTLISSSLMGVFFSLIPAIFFRKKGSKY